MALTENEQKFVDELVALSKKAPSTFKVLYGVVIPDRSEIAWGANNMTFLDVFGIAAYIKAEAHRKLTQKSESDTNSDSGVDK